MIYRKMVDNPGMSIFQNSGHFAAIRSHSPTPEEIEFEQDEIRLQNELKELLLEEFADLNDTNSAINSLSSISTNGYHHNSVEKKSQKLPSRSDASENYRCKSKDYSSLEQLEVLYQVRLREIEKLRSEKQCLQEQYHKEKCDLIATNKQETEKLRDEKKRLQEQYHKDKCDLTVTIKQLRTEKDSMIMSHNEVQKMLVETTSRLSEAERELTGFRQKWSESEQIKSNALHELEMNKITIKELEKRLLAAEKNSYKNEEKNFDNLLKELTSKNKREVSDLQREIHNLTNKIVTKEIDYAKLEARYQSLLSDKKNSNESLSSTLREKLFTLSREVDTLRRSETEQATEIEALKKEKENLLAELTKNQKEQEMLRIGFMDYVTKTDILHQEQISELELASSKKLLELEAKMKELEAHFKDDAMKVFTEEVDHITSIFSNHFDKLNVAVEQLKIDVEEKNSQIRQMVAKIEKFRQETDKIYNKYRNARKIAVTLKQITEDRTQLLRRHHKQYVQTLNEIQKYLDNALISKTVETDKLTELIEKSTKNTMNVDELLGNDEMNAMMLDINKKLMCSE